MAKPKTRCAIYTRKSSEDGLDQEFNSLDAQRESCASYVASQQHEGWVLSANRYDDGGHSGGSLDRPALQSLLRDVDAGQVDRIVVYKIDRLTRSLGDFAKIVDLLDKVNASFVSVTQSFNTSTSMGRLTLNMLLSFAQFEREVTAERIRDKIAASKAKGLWMGGNVPLGYDPHPDPNVRSLVANEVEAKTVRTLFDLYQTHGCLTGVEREAKRLNLLSKPRKGLLGSALSRGAIHKILCNPIYIGKIRHKDKTFDGQHPAVIEKAIWELIQRRMLDKRSRPRGRAMPAEDQSWLKGKMFDDTGDRLTPTHTKKNGRRIRYYISNRLLRGKDPAAWRLPASDIESKVENLVLEHISTGANNGTLLSHPMTRDYQVVRAGALDWSGMISQKTKSQKQIELAKLIERVDLGRATMQLKLDRNSFATIIGATVENISEEAIQIQVPLSVKRRGVEAKLILGANPIDVNVKLQIALAKSHTWLAAIKSGVSIAEIAKEDETSEGLIRKRLQLAFLSPRIQQAIMQGTQPADLTIAEIVSRKVDLDWVRQERVFGFQPTH